MQLIPIIFRLTDYKVPINSSGLVTMETDARGAKVNPIEELKEGRWFLVSVRLDPLASILPSFLGPQTVPQHDRRRKGSSHRNREEVVHVRNQVQMWTVDTRESGEFQRK